LIAQIQAAEFIVPGIQLVFSVCLGAVGYLLKRQIDQNDRKLEALCRRMGQIETKAGDIDKASLVADSLIRERLAVTYVSKDTCAMHGTETRETTTRLFGKVEDLQKGQSKLSGQMDVLIQVFKEKVHVTS
jgi:hypothetical protein